MNFTVSKAPLVAALARCAAIADARATMAILANVLITITPGAIKVFATDLEVGYETAIDISDLNSDDVTLFNGGFHTCVPAKKLHEIIKAVPTSDIHIDIDAAGHKLHISGGSASFKISGIDAEDFPQPPVIDGDEIVIPAKNLIDALTPVAYCQSKDATKTNLQGIWIKFEENADGDVFITTAATDGHRLCLNTLPINGAEDAVPLEYVTELPRGIVIPSKAVTEILHLSTTTDGSGDEPCCCVITVAENKLILSVGTERLSISLAGTLFPDVTRVIPTNTTGRIDIKRQALVDAITRVKVATDKENMRGIRISVAEDGSSIILNATIPSQDIEAQDRITADIVNAPEPVKLSAEYLLQALVNIHQTTVEIHFKDTLSPIIIIPSGTDFPQAVIMPMRSE